MFRPRRVCSVILSSLEPRSRANSNIVLVFLSVGAIQIRRTHCSHWRCFDHTHLSALAWCCSWWNHPEQWRREARTSVIVMGASDSFHLMSRHITRPSTEVSTRNITSEEVRLRSEGDQPPRSLVWPSSAIRCRCRNCIEIMKPSADTVAPFHVLVT